MAVLDSIDDLQKHLADQSIVTNVLPISLAPNDQKKGTYSLSLRDHPKQIPLITEVHHHIYMFRILKDFVHSHNIRMPAR
jgi:hypothetical protein